MVSPAIFTESTFTSFFELSTSPFSVTSCPSCPLRESGLLTVQLLPSLSVMDLPSSLTLPDTVSALAAL